MTGKDTPASQNKQPGNGISTDLHFRAGLITDAQAISDLIMQFAKDFSIAPDGSGADLFHQSVSATAEQSYLADSRYQFILATQGETLAGFISMRDLSHLFHLFVHPAFQGQGLATILWQRARQNAGLQSHIISFTVNSSLNAIPVYERFGFRATGQVVETHGIAFLPMQFQLNK
ncbi:GNAT family N-acetyltransferase [Undibacterium sp. Ji49W]|uniref:GNAT family N-acetyltransferase n=1 Tax=Undibacterium sp. Ji49W TaxID=3413040 RepID=UPI003BF2C012